MVGKPTPGQADWTGHAARILSDAGYRRGGARAAILSVLAAQDCALTAPEIESAVQDQAERAVSRASVYRILEELERLRLVTRLDLGQDQARYEAAHPEGHHHHHMVCTTCGDVVPFEDPDLESSIDAIARRSTFRVDEHDVVLRGTCAGCRA